MKTYFKTYSLQLTALAVILALCAFGLLPADASALGGFVILAVNSSGIPLFAGIEDLDDMFMATMEEMDKEIMDEVKIHHPIAEYLDRANLIEYVDEIGTHVHGFLRLGKNGTVKWVSGYDDADNVPEAKILGETRTAYGQLHGVQMYNLEELTKNSGRQQMIDLVETKQLGLLNDLDEEYSSVIMGNQDADGRKPLGIARIMDPTLACSGIDPATAGNAFWAPRRIYKTGTTNFALATEFRAGIRKLYRDRSIAAGGRVLSAPKSENGAVSTSGRVLLCGEDLYDAHQAYAENVLRLTLADLKNEQAWGDYEMFSMNGTTIIFSNELPAKTGWFVNFRTGIRVRMHRSLNFTFQPWMMLPGKAMAKKRDNLTFMAVYPKSRQANSLIVFS